MQNLRHATFPVGAMLLCACGVTAQGQAQNPEQRVDALHTRRFYLPGDEELFSSGSERQKIVRRAMNDLQSLIEKKELDRRYGAPMHRAVHDIGKWRGEQAVRILLSFVEFRLDPNTFPVGQRYPDYAFYPFAVALAEIGGKEVRQAVLQELAAIRDDGKQRLCVWVLKQSEGPEWVEPILTVAITSAKNREGKQNLEAALRLLHEPQLLPPFQS